MFLSNEVLRRALGRGTLSQAGALLLGAAAMAHTAGAQTVPPPIQFLPATTIVAGSGVKTAPAFTGDNGPALAAQVGTAARGAVEDPFGNIYIADFANNAIRRVDAATGIITTIAGTGAAGPACSACPAAGSTLSGPLSVRSFRGDLYIADTGNNYVRVISGTTGIISIFAGNGNATLPSANADVTRISVRSPQDIAFDATGNAYISTGGGNPAVIRVVPPTATVPTRAVTLVAGTGVTGTTGDGGQATAAQLTTPAGIALDPEGNLYISQTTPNNVRMVSAASGIISTYVGTSGTSTAGFVDNVPAAQALLNAPQHIAVDASGNLYIADQTNQRIRMVSSPANGSIITTVVGTGTAANGVNGNASISAAINQPRSVDLTPAGDLIFSDGFNAEIKVAAPAFDLAPTAVGATLNVNAFARVNSALTLGATIGVPPGYPSFSSGTVTNCAPAAAVAANTLCTVPVAFAPRAAGILGAPVEFTDATGRTYLLPLFGVGNAPAASLSPGVVGALAGNGTAGALGDNAAATAAQLHTPLAVAMDGMGNLFFADTANNEVREISAANGTITRIAGTGVAGFSGDGLAATLATLNGPTGLAIDGAGNLYIADTGNNRIRMVSAGIITAFAGTGLAGFTGDTGLATQATLNAPHGLALSLNGLLYVADTGNNAIRTIGLRSLAINTIAGISGSPGTPGSLGDNGPSVLANLSAPNAVALDNTGAVYIADTGDNVIRRIASSGNGVAGIITTLAGTGSAGFGNGASTVASFSRPSALVVDAAANVYIADSGNNAIRRISAGQVTTVAGTGTAGATGNGGNSNVATLNAPAGVALDGNGNLVIADTGNNVLRSVSASTVNFTYPRTSPSTTSAAQTATLLNAGNLPLAVASVAVPAGFTETASGGVDCNTAAVSLNPGAACQTSIVFAPTAVQAYAGAVTLTNNSQAQPAATQTINVSGTGVFVFTASLSGPATTVAGTPIAVTVTVTNPVSTYAGTIHFTSSDPNPTLPANYTFTAADNGRHTFSGVILGTAGTQIITVTDTLDTTIQATTSVVVTGGPPASLVIVSGTPQSASLFSRFPQQLRVRVLDRFGNPSVGAAVTFTAPPINADAAFNITPLTTSAAFTGISDALGQVITPTLQADGVTGTYAVTATIAGAPTVSFALTNTSTDPVGFRLTSSPVSFISLAPGTTGTVTVTINPTGGFNAPVAVSCTGNIASTTCTVNPTTVAPSGTGAATSFTVTLATTGPAQAINFMAGRTPVYAGLLLLFVGTTLRRRKRLQGLVLALACTFALAGMGGCGSSNFNNHTPEGQYTLTVTGTSGSVTQPLNINYYIGGAP